MMDTQKDTDIKPLNRMKIIYNNDEAILDYLADLHDRRGVRMLDTFVRDSKGLKGVLLLDELTDGVFILILLHDPFGFNEGDNHLVMYANRSLQEMAKYFRHMLDNTHPDTGNIYNAIDDITRLLYWRWCNSQDNDTQINFMG